MKVREINNTDAPLVDSRGNLLPGARLAFQLIDRYCRPVRNIVDAVSNETVSPGTAEVFTDADGLFAIELWPTSRGANSYYYRVRVDSAVGRNIAYFNASLPDGETALAWIEFMALAGLWTDGLGIGISGAGGHTIIINGVEQPTRAKLELSGEGVTVEDLEDRNKVTIGLPGEIGGGNF